MKTYELPEEPDGNIVYSSEGIKFTKHCDVWRMEGSGNAYSWADILEVGEPLTEFPPYNVGENISSNEVWNLSSGRGKEKRDCETLFCRESAAWSGRISCRDGTGPAFSADPSVHFLQHGAAGLQTASGMEPKLYFDDGCMLSVLLSAGAVSKPKKIPQNEYP